MAGKIVIAAVWSVLGAMVVHAVVLVAVLVSLPK